MFAKVSVSVHMIFKSFELRAYTCRDQLHILRCHQGVLFNLRKGKNLGPQKLLCFIKPVLTQEETD